MSLLKGLITPFRVTVILIDGRTESAWSERSWHRTFEGLSPLLAEGRLRPSIQVRALDKAGRAASIGKVSLTAEAARQWAGVEAKGGFLEDIQVLLPGREYLLERGGMPCLYFAMGSFVEPLEERDARYNQFQIVISDPSSRESKVGLIQRFESCLLGASGVVAAFSSRARIFSLNQLESIITEHFVYPGILRTELPEVGRMKGKWERKSIPDAGAR